MKFVHYLMLLFLCNGARANDMLYPHFAQDLIPGWDSMARRWFTIWFWDMSKQPKIALNCYWTETATWNLRQARKFYAPLNPNPGNHLWSSSYARLVSLAFSANLFLDSVTGIRHSKCLFIDISNQCRLCQDGWTESNERSIKGIYRHFPVLSFGHL